MKTNDNPSKERMPELQETLTNIEFQANRLENLTCEIRIKITAIFNPDVPIEKVKEESSQRLVQPDLVGRLNSEIERISEYSNRLDSLLLKLHQIV